MAAYDPGVYAFLSHNREDKEIARALGAQLKLVGADIWFDEWEIRAGDSIPGKVSDALERVETVIVLWSSNASASRWVRAELEAAIQAGLNDGSLRLVPVVLDETPLPALIRATKHVDLRDGDVAEAVNEIMGFANEQARIRAIQGTLEEARIEVEYFHGYGPAVGCPSCGAGLGELRGWREVDERRDDEYAGVRCGACGWEGGGEI